MSIVYHTNRDTGVTYAFESTPRWDPVRKQSRPTRKYLGRVDPITNEIIPSSGRRGRVKKSEDTINDPEMLNRDYKERYEQVLAEAKKTSERLQESERRIRKLEKQLQRAQELLAQFNSKLEQALQVEA